MNITEKTNKQSLNLIRDNYSRISDIAIAAQISYGLCPLPEYSDEDIEYTGARLYKALERQSCDWLTGFVIHKGVMSVDFVEINNFKSLVMMLDNGILICMSKGGIISGHVNKRKKNWSRSAQDIFKAMLNYEQGVLLYNNEVQSDEFFKTLKLILEDEAALEAIEMRKLEEYRGEATELHINNYNPKLPF